MRLTEKQYRELYSKSLDYKISKYHNKKVYAYGRNWDSKKELARYEELSLLEKENVISDLEIQPKFLLIDTIRYNGKTYPKTYYIADFMYSNADGQEVVEDVKSEATRKDKVYRLKIKLFLSKYSHILFKEIL